MTKQFTKKLPNICRGLNFYLDFKTEIVGLSIQFYQKKETFCS